MNENKENAQAVEVDLQRLIAALLNKLWLIVVVSIIGAMISFAVTYFLITPKYEAAAMFYVNNNSISLGGTSVSISNGDLTTSRNLVDSYIIILNTRESLNDVADYAGVDYSYSQLKSMISAAAVNNTEIFQVKVTGTDPKEAEQIANAIAYILPKRISSTIEGTSAKVVEAAVVPAAPSSPSFVKNTTIGFLLGFVLCAAVIVVKEISDVTIRTESDIGLTNEHPILAAVPDMAVHSKGGSYYYGYGGKDKKKAYAAKKNTGDEPALIGSDISFAASEAYKLLRTKLQFSFAEESGCRVIGVSSALSGEGKSLTSVNLAYTLSELGKKVVLVDCDMRRPSLAEKLHIKKAPGLSSYLTDQSDLVSLVQTYGDKQGDNVFHVISAGQNPPNPIELLSSARMREALKILRKVYDYVILDLPPVSEVSDALAVAKDTDGMLLVVRQNYCDRIALSETAHQFEFVQAKILGIVFNCTSVESGKYGKRYYKKYYRKYGKRYGRGYAYAYRAADGQAQKKDNNGQ